MVLNVGDKIKTTVYYSTLPQGSIGTVIEIVRSNYVRIRWASNVFPKETHWHTDMGDYVLLTHKSNLPAWF